MDGEHLAERLGQMGESIKHIRERIENISDRLDLHVSNEEDRLKHIENQLSLGRFLFLVMKAAILTLAFMLAFKFGDISALWKAVIK